MDIVVPIIIFLGYLVYSANIWHISNIIAKNPKLSDDKVKYLCKIIKHVKLPKKDIN